MPIEKISAALELPAADGPRARSVVNVPGENGRVQKIQGKLYAALQFMIWGDESGKPLDWDAAADRAGLKRRAMRLALAKSHVRAFIAAEKKICRETIGAANILVAKNLRDESENGLVRLRALQYLDGTPNDQAAAASGRVVQPGITIVINHQLPPPAVDFDRLIEVNSLHDEAGHD